MKEPLSNELGVFEWLESIKPNVSRKTYQLYCERMKVLTRFANGKPITTTVVNDWLNFLRDEKKLRGISLSIYRSTACQYLETLDVDTRPLKKLVLRSPRRKRYLFTSDELDRIQEVANQDHPPVAEGIDSEWYTAVRIARATALRLGDVCTLRWDAVLIEERGIRLEPRKTKRHGRESEVPLSDDLIHILAKRRMAIKGDYVMPSLAMEYLERGHANLTSAFRLLCKKAGVKGKSFHMLRVGKITEWLANGVPAEVISQTTGQTLAQVLKYARLSMEQKRKRLLGENQ